MIWAVIANGVAPTARRTPISLVRSLTMTSMMLLTPITPAASVPIPTIQTRPRIPVKRPLILLNSTSELKWPSARGSSGATRCRSFSTASAFVSRTEAGVPSLGMSANQPTRSPKWKADWNAVNGTTICCVCSLLSPPDRIGLNVPMTRNETPLILIG